jgi:L-ascorbate metabolism protein UlaG (beta-lactamase superfamily)
MPQQNPRRWPISDHFDGEHFYNPTLPRSSVQSRRSIFRMLWQQWRLRSPWPERVDNKGVTRLDAKLAGGDVAITFVGHATFLIQTAGIAILTDPVWSERASPLPFTGPKRVRQPAVPFDALPRIDLVLLSHNHYDHLDLATLKRLRRTFSPVVLAAAGDARLIWPLGFEDFRELDWWDQTKIGAAGITFVPAQHFSARGPFDQRRSLWGGYMIETAGRRIYFCGDTGYSTHFSAIRSRLGAPDIAILPIGAYEPRWFMKTVHMNPAEAVRAHRDLGAGQSIGMHFGTFQLTTEPIDQPQADLGAALAGGGVAGENFVTFEFGETRIYRAARPG